MKYSWFWLMIGQEQWGYDAPFVSKFIFFLAVCRNVYILREATSKGIENGFTFGAAKL